MVLARHAAEHTVQEEHAVILGCPLRPAGRQALEPAASRWAARCWAGRGAPADLSHCLILRTIAERRAVTLSGPRVRLVHQECLEAGVGWKHLKRKHVMAVTVLPGHRTWSIRHLTGQKQQQQLLAGGAVAAGSLGAALHRPLQSRRKLWMQLSLKLIQARQLGLYLSPWRRQQRQEHWREEEFLAVQP